MGEHLVKWHQAKFKAQQAKSKKNIAADKAKKLTPELDFFHASYQEHPSKWVFVSRDGTDLPLIPGDDLYHLPAVFTSVHLNHELFFLDDPDPNYANLVKTRRLTQLGW